MFENTIKKFRKNCANSIKRPNGEEKVKHFQLNSTRNSLLFSVVSAIVVVVVVLEKLNLRLVLRTEPDWHSEKLICIAFGRFSSIKCFENDFDS